MGGMEFNGVVFDLDLFLFFGNVIFLVFIYIVFNLFGVEVNLMLNMILGLMIGELQFIGQFVVGVCVLEY